MKSFTSLSPKIKDIEKLIPNLDKLPDEDPNRCPLCDGYGHIIDENGARACTCVKREVILSEFNDALIPERFKNETLDTYNPYKGSLRALLKGIKEYVKNYSPSNPEGLYISGGTGSGKSHLATGILKALIEKGYSGVFYNVVDLLDVIRDTFDPNNPANPKSRLVHQLQRQIVVLDDFGVQKTSSWVADRLYALINRRYQDRKTLIVTSEIPMPQLMLRVDRTLASRIIDMCKEIVITADDYRLRIRQKEPWNPRTRSKSKTQKIEM